MSEGDAAALLCDGAGRLVDHGSSWPNVTPVGAAPPPSKALDDFCWHTCLGCGGCRPYAETVGVE